MAMLFAWMLPVFRVGARKSLELEDLPQETYRRWSLRSNQLQTSSLMGVVRAFRKETAFTAALTAANLLCTYLGPYLVYTVVESLAIGTSKRWLLVLAMAQVGELICERNRFFQLQLMSLRIRSCLSSMVFSKGLKVGHSSSPGEMVNYMATDVDQASSLPWCLHIPWVLPLELGLALLVLGNAVGMGIAAASISGLAVVSVVKAWKLAAAQENVQECVAQARGERMKCALESFKYMKTLKFHAWEKVFLGKLLQLRRVELGAITKLVFLENLGRHLSWSSPALVLLLMFAACIAAGRPLSAKVVLSALGTCQIIQGNLQDYIHSIPRFTQAKVSLHRLDAFFHEPEVSSERPTTATPASLPVGSISIRGGTFSWDASIAKPTVSDLDLDVEPGNTLGVCGPVGSGKSSLLSCILGEIPKMAGNVQVSGKVAYVPQTPWIRNCTIQENILFGDPMERSRYEKTLQVCQLLDDLSMLEEGDQTQIGDRGANLSGGQKQRVQLARAVYADADVYLLDDPISAVDSNTASRIIEDCIYGVLRNKTIVLATHQKSIFRSPDKVLFLGSGRVVNSTTVVASHPQVEAALPRPVQDYIPGTAKTSSSLQEDRKRGAVHSSVYRSYLTSVARGYVLIPGLLVAHLLFQLVEVSRNWWFASYSSESNLPASLLAWYMTFAVASCVFLGLRLLLVSNFGLAASQSFFADMVNSIFHAPMSFFDTTPLGRIVTRLSSDQTSLDFYAPQRLSGLAFSMMELLIILGIMSQVPLVLLMASPVVLACIYLQRYYAATIRELPRLISIFQAPVVHRFEESLAGASVIRAFAKQDFLLHEYLATLDCSLRPVFYNFSSMECLALHTGLLVNLVFFVFMLALISFPSINTALAGVAITYALRLNAIQCSLVWDMCDAEKRVVAVERILQYTNMNTEGEWSLADSQVPKNWPSLGELELENLEARYQPGGPLILKGITCRIPGGNRTSIIGRTGSGKSTLINCLFRIVEPGKNQIFIDGVDITSVGLHDLRSKLLIIPQEPVMFEGNVRHNLDPLGVHDNDSELWEVLEKCHLFGDVSQAEFKLDSPVAENGENWSVGQRQLFCLARILLNKGQAKILVLDEATASVDSAAQTAFDALIQHEFRGITVINITHRLESTGNSDMVLQLSNGELVTS